MLSLVMLLPALPPQSADWAFLDAQESFVVECVGLDAAVRSLPVKHRAWLEQLGSHDYQVRENGSVELTRACAVRASLLGARSRDPEVWLRSRNVLRRLSVCVQCAGSGGREEAWGGARCMACRGVGHYWPLDDFDE